MQKKNTITHNLLLSMKYLSTNNCLTTFTKSSVFTKKKICAFLFWPNEHFWGKKRKKGSNFRCQNCWFNPDEKPDLIRKDVWCEHGYHLSHLGHNLCGLVESSANPHTISSNRSACCITYTVHIMLHISYSVPPDAAAWVHSISICSFYPSIQLLTALL